MLDHAIEYASRGWKVFPVKPGDKVPMTKHGFLEATADLEQITKWWTDNPTAGIGVATGSVSGILVLDVDPRNGGVESLQAFEARHGELPHTIMCVTGGGGSHYYFLHPGGAIRCAANFMGFPGLDLKSDGGYVVAPPSIHPSGRAYAWELAHHPDETSVAPVPIWIEQARVSQQPMVPAAGIGHKVPQGQRDNYLTSVAGGMRAKGMPPEAIFKALKAVNETMLSVPLPEADVARISRSMDNYTAGRIPEEDGSDLTLEALEAGMKTRTYYAETELPPQPSLMGEGLLAENSFAVLHGDEGLGKTWLALHLATCVANGTPFLGIATKKARCLYVGTEINDYIAKPRLKQIDDLITPEGAQPLYACDDLIMIIPPGFQRRINLGERKHAELLARLVQKHKIQYLTIDPYSDHHDLDENDASDMARVIVDGIGLVRMAGAAVMAVHHNRKGPSDSPDQVRNALRGSKKIRTSAQCVMSLWEEKGLLRLEFSKVSYSAMPDPIWLRAHENGGFVQAAPPKDQAQVKENRKYNLVSAMAKMKTATVQQLAEDPLLTGVSARSIQTYLREMVESGRAVYVPGRPPKYTYAG